MADYKTLKHEEQNLEMNAGNSLNSAIITYGLSFATTVGAICANAAGESKLAIYSAGIAFFSLLASGFCGMSHDKDINRLEEVRKELKGLEGKLGGK